MEKISAVGVMSGTSLDGVDLCLAEFWQNDLGWHFQIISAETVPYDHYWKENLKSSVAASSAELAALHSEYGFFLGTLVNDFLAKNALPKPDLISSHGHTVFHQPQKKFTLQIGDGRAIKAVTGITTVYDFRSQDVLLGGNGAPLVPVGDELLFPKFAACLNLGGFSNISFRKNNRRVAFDICPVNTVLNKYSEALGFPFDEGGRLAAAGKIDFNLLKKLNDLEFYRLSPPKSLGTEWLEAAVFPLLMDADPQTVLATFTEHIAVQMAHIFGTENFDNVLVTGGGAYNDHLISVLRDKTKAKVILPDDLIINFKEALIFAFLGVLKFRGEENVLSSATGARCDHSSGLVV